MTARSVWKPVLLLALCAGLSVPGLAKNRAGEIVRHPTAQPGPILAGVTIPPGAETLILSGQVPSPIDPANRANLEAFGNTETQAVNVFKKVEAELIRQGWTMKDVVKLQIFLVGDPRLAGRMDFAGLNAAYKQFFGTTENPNLVARTTMQIAGLANPFFLVEIEATAARVPPKK
jgi:2-iminobutanoate/2-iminopropanoate deaminase